jgi:tRNA-2-methylthio-N6-dimethylallyladenosine synthase
MTPPTKKVFIETFGCQMNLLDSELVLHQLKTCNFEQIESPQEADLILYNTCSVREHAEQKVYSRLGTLKHYKTQKPNVRIGVLGCMAQKEGEALLRRMPHIDLICGTGQIFHMKELLKELEETTKPVIALQFDPTFEYERDPLSRSRSFQAFVSVMRGCNDKCTFCIVPTTRGAVASRSIQDIQKEVELLCADGCKEITLLGQNVNSYGHDLQEGSTLAKVLEAIHETQGLQRIRFITSHPRHLEESLFRVLHELPKVCEYLHIPAQSGSNRILRMMKRFYTAERYKELIHIGREICPEIEYSSDFIVGFPSETEEDFEKTYELMREVHFVSSFIFKYSIREGTAATHFEDDVPQEVKEARNQSLLELQKKQSQEKK